MNNAGNIERLKVWRQIADTIRRGHMSHQWRNEKMELLSGVIATSVKYSHDPDMTETVNTLQEVLSFLRTEKYLNHTDVKNGLSLFVLICDIQIDLWTPKPVGIVQPQVDEVGDLPF